MDETTDIRSVKQWALFVIYFNFDDFTVKIKFLNMIESAKGGSRSLV